MSDLERKFAVAKQDFSQLMTEFAGWIGDLSAAERVLGVCGFALTIMWFIMRQPARKQSRDEIGNQFSMAVFLVMLFGLGIGWIFNAGDMVMARLSA